MKAEAILEVIKERVNRHPNITWESIVTRLDSKKLEALVWMEETQGEPDVFVLEDKRVVFMDANKETPLNRRSLCYDEKALIERQKNKPKGSVFGQINDKNLSLLNERLYRYLQSFKEIDTKTSSWLETPTSIRNLGGALFGDRRYNTVFVYHNGADSYYASRGFRCILYVDE